MIGIGIGLWLLFRFPKQMGLTALGIAALGAAIFGYFWFQGVQADRERANIVTKASTDGDVCSDPKYPILVAMRNRTGKTVEQVSFMLQGRRPNRSGTVFNEYRSSDYIMEPDKGSAACFAVDTYGTKADEDLKALNWTVDVLSVTFQ